MLCSKTTHSIGVEYTATTCREPVEETQLIRVNEVVLVKQVENLQAKGAVLMHPAGARHDSKVRQMPVGEVK